MGYYSEVTIFIQQDKKQLDQIVDSIKKVDEYFDEDDYEIKKTSLGKDVLKIYFSSTKWYDSFPIVQLMEEIINNLDDENYLFTRVGEEYDDIEISGEYGYAYPVSYVEFDVDF